MHSDFNSNLLMLKVIFLSPLLPLAACSSAARGPSPYAQQAQALQPDKGNSVVRSPRGRAVQNLIRKAKAQLEQNDIDASLASFGRAVSLDPDCGVCEYGLAEAWLQKGDKGQAKEHHLRARRLLSGRAAWDQRLDAQKHKL